MGTVSISCNNTKISILIYICAFSKANVDYQMIKMKYGWLFQLDLPVAGYVVMWNGKASRKVKRQDRELKLNV